MFSALSALVFAPAIAEKSNAETAEFSAESGKKPGTWRTDLKSLHPCCQSRHLRVCKRRWRRFAPPSPETREAVWRHAGPQRNGSSLEPLLDDPYPLARLIARAALERRESRVCFDHAPSAPTLS